MQWKFGRNIVFALVLSVMAGALLSGCDKSKADSKVDADNPLKGDKSEQYYMVTFLSGIDFWKECYRGFKDAGDQLGVSTQYTGTTDHDVNNAVSVLEQIIAKKPDGIAVSAMDVNAYVAPINKAVNNGIPLVTFDSDSPNSERAAFLGTGNYNAGVEMAKQTAKIFPKGTNPKIAIMTVLGQTNIAERVQGFTDTVKKDYPYMRIVQVVNAGTDQTQAATIAANTIKAHPDLDMIFTVYVDHMVGALSAIKEAGKQGKIKLTTFDTDKVTLQNIQSGDVAFSIAQGPYNEGYWAMMMLYAMKHNNVHPVSDWQKYKIKPLPPIIDTGSYVVNKDNLDAYLSR